MSVGANAKPAQHPGIGQGSLVAVAQERARRQPNALAYAYLADGGIEAASFTYAQLDVAARKIAAGLLESASPGDRALLVYETGIDFVSAFYGCMYAGVIAVPIPAPEASRLMGTRRRIKAITEDCDARSLLCNPHTDELLHAAGIEGSLTTAQRIDTSRFADRRPLERVSPPDPESLAYLQYTSGSTATPKGVMVTHANVMGHLAEMQEALDYNRSSVSVSWMPHFHDYALIEGFLMPMFNGTPAYFMSPFAFLKRPVSWLRAIHKYAGTHTQGPNFAYRYCVRRISAEERTALDLGSWRSAGNAAEPIHPATCEEFYKMFAPCGLRKEALRPCYGLAELTLLATATPMSESPVVGRFSSSALGRGEAAPVSNGDSEATAVVGCGVAFPRTRLAIVEPASLRRLPEDRVGEVWVSAVGVAQGYWGRPEESRETFRATIAGEGPATYLRTGDLGFLHDGQLYITARAKDLIIIRGTNYSPQDIEWTVQQASPALRPDHGAAFGVQVDGEERLCVVQELERGQYGDDALEQIFSDVAQAVGDYHGIALHAFVLIRKGSLLKTSSGKIQRQGSRTAYLGGSLKVIKAWDGHVARAPQASGSAATDAERPEMRTDTPSGSNQTGRLLGWLREYAEKRINSRLIDERRCVPPHIILDFGNQGLFGLQASAAHGGLGLSHRDTLRIYQQLGAIDLTLATFVFLHNTNGLLPIMHFAKPALRDELMPMLARGREIAAFALSEPCAGSNLGGVQMRAESDGEGWKLHGVKRWNGSAWAGVITVFARLVDDGGRLRGLSAFVVRQSEPGLSLGPEALTMGVRGIMQNSLHLDGVKVGRERLLGGPGDGLKIAEHVLSHGRVATASIALGGMQRCAQLMLRFASRRQIESGLLLRNPQAGLKITELLHRIAITQESLQSYTERLDTGHPIEPEIAMAIKVSATDSLNLAADLLVQVLGGRGYMENNLAPQLFRDARLLSIGEGANEGLIAALGRSLRLGDTVRGYLRGQKLDDLAARLGELSDRVERLEPPAAFAGDSAPQWRDFLRGRLGCASLELASARARGGDVAAWAQHRFDRLVGELDHASAEEIAMSADQIQQQVGSYKSMIGDLEPLAADVDVELDPLLRRESAAQAAEDVEQMTPEQKRERLRRLLGSKPTEAGD